ncbi:MAG: hypothetical protein J7621_27375 [Niastella sp.]|nr:hypothetical protein [Niastella sp.]
MKYKVFLSLLLLIITGVSGCKKDSGGDAASGENYIRFKVDGKQVAFRALTQSQLNYSAGTGLHLCIMLASEEAMVANRNIMTITVNGNEAAVQGINYDLVTPLTLSNGTTTTKGSLVYLDNSGAGYVAQGPQRTTATADMAAHVQITDLKKDYMKGNFSAVAFHATDFSKKVSITDGEFYLKRVN